VRDLKYKRSYLQLQRNECKRVLASAADEAASSRTSTDNLLLGLLCEERWFAAELLHQCGLQVSAIREELGSVIRI
jgi:ATP-dependent Clp protease ATP-binding subunit ClpC